MELRGDFQVVVLRTGTAAERAEVEPDHATRAAHRADFTRLDVHHRVLVGHLGQLAKGLLHRRVRRRAQRAMVELDVRERALAVVGAVVHAEHFQP
ncbi:hypothetical protein D9M68_991820 [compost metagenome]